MLKYCLFLKFQLTLTLLFKKKLCLKKMVIQICRKNRFYHLKMIMGFFQYSLSPPNNPISTQNHSAEIFIGAF